MCLPAGVAHLSEFSTAASEAVDAIEAGEDGALLACLDGSREKLRVLRRAVWVSRERNCDEISLDALLPVPGE